MESKQTQIAELTASSEEPPIRKKVKMNGNEQQTLHEFSVQIPAMRIKIADEKIEIKAPQKQSDINSDFELPSLSQIKKLLLNEPYKFNDTYTGIKYKNTVYRLYDNLLIKNESDSENDFLGRLIRIIRANDPEEINFLAILEVQWFYKKSDLPKKYASYLRHISENEIFLSSHNDFIMVDCINGTFNLLSYDEYERLDQIPPLTFYIRANFDVVKKTMIPPIEEWPKHCICRSPVNPDYTYILCDVCKKWFHLECLKLTIEEADSIDNYVCSHCEQRMNGYILSRSNR